MAFHTFLASLAYDEASRRGVAGTVGKVTDHVTGVPVDVFDKEGNPTVLVSNASGFVGQFKADSAYGMVDLTFGNLTMTSVAVETTNAGAAAAVEIINVSDRLNSVEVIAGLAAGDTSDATVKSHIINPSSDTRGAVSAAIAEGTTQKLDKSEAAATYATNASVTTEIADRVDPLVAAAIASDSTVANAAAAAADTAVDASLDSSPRIPRIIDIDGQLVEAFTDGADRVTRGTLASGAQYVRALQVGPGVNDSVEAMSLDNVGWTPFVDSAGRLPEIYLLPDGRMPQSMIDRISERLSGGASSGSPIDIVLNAGQSNATAADLYPASITHPDGRVLLWDSTTGTYGQHPVSGAEYLGWSFARSYARNRLIPGNRVAIVDMAHGSTGFSSTSLASPPAGYHTVYGGTWDRTLTADPKNRYIMLRNAALAAVAAAPVGSKIVAVLWSQGEEDRAMTQSAYGTALDDMVTQLRIDLDVPALPVVIGSMTPETIAAPVSIPVNKALLDTPRRMQQTTYAPGPAGMSKQGEVIHWSAAGQTHRGAMFEGALDKATLNRADNKPLPPLGLALSRSGDIVTVKWEPPYSRVTSYALEASVAGGAWASVTLDGLIPTGATFTAIATSSVKIRATSTNELGTSAPTQEVSA